MNIPLQDRQRGILDTDLLRRSHVVQIGAGRGLGFAEMLVGCGLGKVTLLDPQTVSAENVGQSAYTRSAIGQPKVHAAKERLLDINPDADIIAKQCRAENLPDLDGLFAAASLIKIGIDDPAIQFGLADRTQAAGTPAVLGGNTGDGQQFFAVLVWPGGPSLKELLPAAWRAIQQGFSPPDHYASSRLHAERLNVLLAGIALGLLHHAGGSSLPISRDGAAAIENPVFIGFHGMSDSMLTPIVMLPRSPG
jgi:hypothetical protein